MDKAAQHKIEHSGPLHAQHAPGQEKRASLGKGIFHGLANLYAPRRTREEEEQAALDESVIHGPVGLHAAHAQPEFADLALVWTLDPALLPQPMKSDFGDDMDAGRKGKGKKSRRLIVVGDVHGMKTSLEELLAKVDFDKETDHLILAGDIISKGPDSAGVVDLAMELGASAVRGNHEDRVLLAYDGLFAKHIEMDLGRSSGSAAERDAKLADLQTFSHSMERKDRVLARKLKPKRIEWLKNRPVILRVGPIPGMGQVIVVHAGLVPGVDLHQQDPYYVMNMRTIDLKTHIPSNQRDGTAWTKVRLPLPSAPLKQQEDYKNVSTGSC
jgi:hypothetical protein